MDWWGRRGDRPLSGRPFTLKVFQAFQAITGVARGGGKTEHSTDRGTSIIHTTAIIVTSRTRGGVGFQITADFYDFGLFILKSRFYSYWYFSIPPVERWC